MTREKKTKTKPPILLDLNLIRKAAVELRMERQLDALVTYILAEQEAKTDRLKSVK